jgi:hypothetical protein
MFSIRPLEWAWVGLVAAGTLAWTGARDGSTSGDANAAARSSLGATDSPPRATPGLRYPEEYSAGIFRWETAPDWIITDVLFGVRDGNLVFAKYTAIPPGYEPKVHDNTDNVDWILWDTMDLPVPVQMKLNDAELIMVSSLSFTLTPKGEVQLASLSGVLPGNVPFEHVYGGGSNPGPVGGENGACGNPTVLGTCTDFCIGTCKFDQPDRDPCDCPGGVLDWCWDGTAMIVCPNGTCSRTCIFTNQGCGCFVCNTSVQVSKYCTGKTNSMGCIPDMHWSGAPMANMTTGFVVSADGVLNNVFGVLIYSANGPAFSPFQGGILCLASPVSRTGGQNSGGSPLPPASNCSGNFKIQFNQVIASGVNPALVPGAAVALQYWSRDPADPAGFGSSLTDAIYGHIAVCQ